MIVKRWAIDNTVELTCNASGNPPPLISWRKENSKGSFVPLPGGDGQWTSSPSVIKVEMSEDTSGTYRCVAKNSEGMKFEDEELTAGKLFFLILKHRNSQRMYM